MKAFTWVDFAKWWSSIGEGMLPTGLPSQLSISENIVKSTYMGPFLLFLATKSDDTALGKHGQWHVFGCNHWWM